MVLGLKLSDLDTLHKVVEADTYACCGRRIVQEVDGHGNHRLGLNHRRSNWYTFKQIAILDAYRGTTEFYSPTLPRVFWIDRGIEQNGPRKRTRPTQTQERRFDDVVSRVQDRKT